MQIIFIGLLFASLTLIGAGYFTHAQQKGKFLIITGYCGFTLYWLSQAPRFILIDDFVNATLSALALPFFAFISFHEYLSIKKKENLDALKFLAGLVFFAGILYFAIEKIPWLAIELIKVCAEQTAWLSKLLGYNVTIGAPWYDTFTLQWVVPLEGTDVDLILACTGLQSIAIFVGIALAVNAPIRRRFYTFLATVPVIWVLNLLRNVLIIHVSQCRIMSAELAHNTLGKAGSFMALIIIVLYVVKLLPELQENLLGLVDLRKRKI